MIITIDGKEISVNGEQTVLEAALAANIYIPNLCTHPALPVQAGCKLCVVEIDGRPVQACETAAHDGMCVTTKSDDISRRRNVAMELMLAGHPQDCTSCKVYLKCELQALMQYMGTVHSRLRTVQRETNSIPSVKNPLILREMERCVQCGRCVRACENLRGVGAIGYAKHGGETYIGTESNAGLAEAGCRFCGACIEVCPTGALQDEEGVLSQEIAKHEALVPCQVECPAKIDISEYLRLINEGKYSQAHAVVREKAPFPHTLGYICNHRCEDGCKRGKLNSSISIRNVKRYAVENDSDMMWHDKAMAPLATKSGKKVAVIGSGPCGLTAALYLQKKGHDVTVHEKLPVAGGQLVTGIPEYRLPLEHVQKEIDFIKSVGVEIKTNSNIDSVTRLKEGYDAVLVAIGASQGKKLSMEGSNLEGAYAALDLLRDVRLGLPVDVGQTVNIIGGGNVAFDCARTLLRMGRKVNIICLEKGEAIPADAEEIEEGINEGVVLYDGTATVQIESENGVITGHRIADVDDTSTERMIPCDSIVFAVGQGTGLTPEFGIDINDQGHPTSDKSDHTTSVDGVFAAGDVMTGTRFVIEAIAAGREVAKEIDRYLGGDGCIDETLSPRAAKEPKIGKIDGFAEMTRVASHVHTCDEATREAGRCLQCDLRRDIGPVKLWTEYTAN